MNMERSRMKACLCPAVVEVVFFSMSMYVLLCCVYSERTVA